jgi:uncharacterized membrane protein HdeD (DUF308 family)
VTIPCQLSLETFMTAIVQDRFDDVLNEEAAGFRKNWGWFLSLGIMQVIVGIFAVGFAVSATLASVMTLGVLLIIAAGAQTAAAVLARDWGGFFLFLLLGIVYAVAGFLMIQHPLIAAESLTLMLAAIYLIGGMFRIISALVERFDSWGWVLLNGVIAMLLGFLIWQQWPWSGLWVLGTFVGIDLIVNGVTWSALAISVRSGLTRLAGR